MLNTNFLRGHIGAIVPLLLLFPYTGIARSQVITTIAGNGVQGYAGDNGPATQAEIDPEGVSVDRWSNIYSAEPINHVVRRIDRETGIITTLAGTGQTGDTGDGGPAKSARLNYPWKLAISREGDVYIADADAYRVRRVDRETGIISAVAGTGNNGFSGDGSLATNADLSVVTGLAFDADQNLYIADAGNYRIRRVDHRTGIITTVVGNGTFAIGGGTGEGGPATQAGFVYDLSIAFNPWHTLYVADSGLSNVRRIDRRTDIISTVAGEHLAYPPAPPPSGYSGDGGPAFQALLNFPDDITFDCSGNLYLSDTHNNRVRRVNARTKIITTIAGNGIGGFSGDGGSAAQAELFGPRGLAIDRHGNLIIADDGNMRIRLIRRWRRESENRHSCADRDDEERPDRGQH